MLMVTFPLKFIMVLLCTFFIGILLTPLVRILAFKIDAVDYPNARRINKKPMPSAGGLAVVIAFSITSLIMMPTIVQVTFRGETYFDYIWPVVLGGGVVALTGLIDDVKELSPLPKLLGIVAAASLIWLLTDFRLNDFKIPFGGPHLFFPPWLSFILTLIWIVSITNAVNLMDGLDGLVSGVSIISLLTMGVVSYFFLPDHNLFLTLTIFVLVASIAGFFPYNYHPAIIYGGDTGALFIGFMISVLSLQGLKNATAVAVVTPMIILGVPIADTFLAIVRRTLSGQKFYQPDRNHLHHRLLSLGLTHRGTVLVIYGISLIFATISLLLNISSRVGGVLLVIGLLFGVELLAELIEILGPNRTPLLKIMRYIGNSSYREEVRRRWKNKEHK
ncbi:glycosyltransferase family 4 protein [Streptococcus gordonii]|uniref:glycosyltransferase family 4 protein n=1 Tax=Streptococcus gordonii TaxID=1302 RepID=UPI0023ECE8CB|nr:MraY family glycosyltransferase [Streptococcus gordonii]